MIKLSTSLTAPPSLKWYSWEREMEKEGDCCRSERGEGGGASTGEVWEGERRVVNPEGKWLYGEAGAGV